MSRSRRPHPRPSGRRPPSSLYPTLDLHGYTADEAEREAERWLQRRARDGEPIVRLITGRGRHSHGPPVLPALIRDLLGRCRGTLVEDFNPESGGGAFLVWLVRAAKHPPPRSRSNSAIPLSIVRAAEEALAELGIAPTPILIEAEARRIMQEQQREAE